MYAQRLAALRQTLERENLDGLIISKKENLFYLTGTHTIHPTNREALLFVSSTQLIMYHSSFLTPQALPGLTSIPMSTTNGLQNALNQAFPKAARLGFEAANLTVAELERLKDTVSAPEYIPTQNLLETQRITKDSLEIKAIKKACSITAKSINWILSYIRENSPNSLTEIGLLRTLENHFYDLGADGLAFPTIIACDQNAALPHHQSNNTPIGNNSVVLIDCGCSVAGYCSDMTRTIKLGEQTPEFVKVETAVKAAQEHALATLKPSHPTAAAVDQAARQSLTKAGYGNQFIHSTGHGLGLEIHEQPSLYYTNTNTQLTKGMTITIEPGVYLPGKFGYRHEDTILLTESGLEILTL